MFSSIKKYATQYATEVKDNIKNDMIADIGVKVLPLLFFMAVIYSAGKGKR